MSLILQISFKLRIYKTGENRNPIEKQKIYLLIKLIGFGRRRKKLRFSNVALTELVPNRPVHRF